MKLTTRCGVLVAALASLAAAGAGSAAAAAPAPAPASASSSAAPAGPPHHRHFGHGPGSFMLGTLLRASKELNLSSDQQQQIKSLLTNARTQARAQGGQGAVDIAVLGNPADPNYATAVQTAKTSAANRIQLESELQGQVYNVLTTEQKNQLPGVLAGIKAKMAARRAQHAQHGAVAPN